MFKQSRVAAGGVGRLNGEWSKLEVVNVLGEGKFDVMYVRQSWNQMLLKNGEWGEMCQSGWEGVGLLMSHEGYKDMSGYEADCKMFVLYVKFKS